MGLLDAGLFHWLTLISTHSFSSLCPCAAVSLFIFSLRLPPCPFLVRRLLHLFLYSGLNLQRNDHQHKDRSTTERRDGEVTKDGQKKETSLAQRDGVKDKEEVKERQRCGGRDRWGCRDEVKERQSRKQRERGRCNYLSGVRVCVTEEEAH